MAYIYQATNKVNGKKYIGQTTYDKLRKRISTHWWYANNSDSNLPFPNALRKYGKDNFDWTILEECNTDQRGQREMYWIDKIKPEYNATLGGDGGSLGRPCPEHVKEATRQARIVSVMDKTTGKTYSSMKEAREDTGVSESIISRHINKYQGQKRWIRM
jgi:group I intron endonuclease